jgi:hypothetical protein
MENDWVMRGRRQLQRSWWLVKLAAMRYGSQPRRCAHRGDPMNRNLMLLVVLAGLSACQPAAAPVAEAPSAPVAEASGPDDGAQAQVWALSPSPVLTLAFGGDGLSIACEEATGVMRISFAPAWEKEGPFDKAVVHFGDMSFPVTIDAAAMKDENDRYRPVYLLSADADTVTAVMLANNARLVVTNPDGEQERSGTVDEAGVFDMFATTCAQINGLR